MKLAILSLIFALTTQSTYVQKYSHLAQISSEQNGIPVAIILAQGILESGAGNSKLARNNNNHFGIKRNGKYAKFASVADCFEAHGKIFAAKRYDRCRACRDDVNCWAVNLQPCGYAADKNYAAAILKAIKQYNLIAR